MKTKDVKLEKCDIEFIQGKFLAGDEIQWEKIGKYLRLGWRTLVAMMAIGLATGTYVALSVPVIFQTTTEILIPRIFKGDFTNTISDGMGFIEDPVITLAIFNAELKALNPNPCDSADNLIKDSDVNNMNWEIRVSKEYSGIFLININSSSEKKSYACTKIIADLISAKYEKLIRGYEKIVNEYLLMAEAEKKLKMNLIVSIKDFDSKMAYLAEFSRLEKTIRTAKTFSFNGPEALSIKILKTSTTNKSITFKQIGIIAFWLCVSIILGIVMMIFDVNRKFNKANSYISNT